MMKKKKNKKPEEEILFCFLISLGIKGKVPIGKNVNHKQRWSLNNVNSGNVANFELNNKREWNRIIKYCFMCSNDLSSSLKYFYFI